MWALFGHWNSVCVSRSWQGATEREPWRLTCKRGNCPVEDRIAVTEVAAVSPVFLDGKRFTEFRSK